MKRNEFLKLTMAGFAGVALTPPLIGKAFSAEEVQTGSSFDVLIVGTGYGSAVAAERLAETGKRVLMLEMGMDWKNSGIPFSKMAWAEKQSTWLRNTTVAPFANFRSIAKFTGVLDRVDFENVKIYHGRGIGGGSLANGGMSVTPKREYFEEIFPNLNSEEFYTKYFPKANNGLGVNTIPEDFYQSSEYYQFSRIGEEEGQNAGYETIRVPNVYDYDYMQQEERGEVEKSALDGEVIYGNNHGKKDLTKTYIKRALDSGNVSILALHKVELIRENNDGSYTLDVSFINTKGETIEQKQFNTQKLILGAGSVGTTKLLLKSEAKGTLTNLDNSIGENWGNNGNTMCGRNFTAPRGAKQSTMPAAGIDGWSENIDAIFAEIAPLPVGMETYTALYLIINRVPVKGSFSYNSVEDKLELDWGDANNAHMVENAENFIQEMNDVNGGTRAGLLFDNGIGKDICYHPLGGCVLGESTDEFGRLKNHENIYVLDGALIPATIGVNPYVTITAIAEYCIENIIEQDINSFNNSVEIVEEALTVAPVPFNDYLNIQFNAFESGNCVVEVINWAGRTVAQESFNVERGNVRLNMTNGLSRLWRQNYTLRITLNNQVMTKRIRK